MSVPVELQNRTDYNQGSGLIWTIINAIGAVGRKLSSKIYDQLNVKDFGAVGDGVADDTGAIQSAINAAKILGRANILLEGKFRITDSLKVTRGEFYGPNLIGAGAYTTEMIYDFDSKKAAIVYTGGSGSLAQASIIGIKFSGSATSVAIELDGQGGVSIDECKFDTNAVGIWFHCKSGGTFTECCVARRSDFTVNCLVDLEYTRETGTPTGSFHGSGMMDCTSNVPSGGNLVKIGAHCIVYNAPLDCRVWAYTACSLILVDSDADYKPTFYGNITIETSAGKGGGDRVNLATGKDTYIGDVTVFGAVRDDVAHCTSRTRIHGPYDNGVADDWNGATTRWNAPYVLPEQTYSGPTAIVTNDSKCLGVFVKLRNTAGTYAYNCYVLFTTGTSSTPAVIGPMRNVDSVAYGAPVFTVSGNDLVVTNANYDGNGVVIYACVTQLSQMFSGVNLEGW